MADFNMPMRHNSFPTVGASRRCGSDEGLSPRAACRCQYGLKFTAANERVGSEGTE
jgi:hypothetical protein